MNTFNFAFLVIFFTWTDFVRSSADDVQYAGKKEVCMGELGCFETGGDFFHPLYRPIDLLPQARHVINPQFKMFTKDNTKEAHLLRADKKDSLLDAPFHMDEQIIFIVHGFLDTELFGKWQEQLKDELLMHSDINCIIVDWSGGNKPPYAQATANTRVVGAEISLLVEKLVETRGLSPMKMHIIGHSLGSHIAGYAGERIKKLGRITGLDPAEPYFQNLPPTVRLDPTDADFVDVIHSDAKSILLLGLGMEQQVGHIDFYPNNGREQPGCKTSKFTSFVISGLVEGGRRFVSCNHQRAIDFFSASINYKAVLPVGIECKDWETFLDGKCAECGPNGEKCGIMGIRGYEFYPNKKDDKQVKVFLKTSGTKPFWLYHYSISVKLHNAKLSKDQKGTLSVTLNGDLNDAYIEFKSEDLYHGSTYNYLFTTSDNLGNIKSVTFKWKSGKLLGIIRKPKLYVEYIKVSGLNYVEKAQRKKHANKFCHGAEKEIDSKQLATFIAC